MVCCQFENCSKRAIYGYKYKEPLMCSTHRIMKPNNIKIINVNHKRCKCGKVRPSFGLISDITPTCCINCKTDEMINIKDNKCKCGEAIPCFGLIIDTTPTCC